MKKYPKIETLFKRDENFKITNKIRLPEFENIKKWLITEKIDGTNIRILYKKGDNHSYITFRGRTDKAQIPTFLERYLTHQFLSDETLNKFEEIFNEAKEVCLYGEGYGQRIQKGGGNYNKGNSFRLFDVWIDGWWLEWDKVCEVADQLGIKVAPESMITDIETITEIVKKNNLLSEVAMEEGIAGHRVEGIVARAYPMMLFRNGIPIKFKLKIKDYKEE